MKKKPSIVCITIKVIIAFLLALFIIFFAKYLIQEVKEDTLDKNDMARYIRSCDRDYYDRKFGRLYDTLTLYDLHGDDFEIYWEALDGYLAYQDYFMWKKAEQAGMKQATQRMKCCKEKLEDLSANCKYDLNQQMLNDWADKIAGADFDKN